MDNVFNQSTATLDERHELINTIALAWERSPHLSLGNVLMSHLEIARELSGMDNLNFIKNPTLRQAFNAKLSP